MKIYRYIIPLFLFFSGVSEANQPDVFLKETVDKISHFITENKEMLENDEQYLKEKVNELVMPVLDIGLMSKIVLGKRNWIAANLKQQEAFESAFKDLLIRTYMKSLTEFDGEKIKFLPYKPGKKKNLAKIKSLYLIDGGDIPVDYRLKVNSNNEWKVYDIVFDGVSLLKNYRTDFQEHIKNKGLDSLISELNS